MPDEELRKFLDGVVGVCEATSCEYHYVWEHWHERVEWKQNNMGLGETVGTLDDRPVHISLRTAEIDGKKILFWEATSQVVDHEMIRKWLQKNLPITAFREGDPRQGVNQTDATNFHIIVPLRKAA